MAPFSQTCDSATLPMSVGRVHSGPSHHTPSRMWLSFPPTAERFSPTHIWPLESRARTLIFPTESSFFQGLLGSLRRVAQRLHSQRHREVRLLWLPPATGRHQTHMGARPACLRARRRRQSMSRPRNSTVPPAGRSKRQAGPERTPPPRRSRGKRGLPSSFLARREGRRRKVSCANA